tara:strand:+ start:4266 stop:5192 length:927 start_codon:yes stop_codon:yes gene_type:complete
MGFIDEIDDNDITVIHHQLNYPLWQSSNASPNPGFIPPDEFNTYKRTKFITAMVASNVGKNTSTPKGIDFTGSIYQNTLSIDINQNPPNGFWVINPNETIPCDGYNATNCSLVNRVRQMWELQKNDNGLSTNDWYPNGDIDTVEVGYNGSDGYLFNHPPHTDNTFGFNPGPYKMSDFYNKGHWSLNSIMVEEPTGPNEITIHYYWSVSSGYKVVPEGEQIHLGGNPSNPTGVSGETSEFSGENVNYEISGDSYQNVNVVEDTINALDQAINTEVGTLDERINVFYDTVSDSIINISPYTEPVNTNLGS